MTHVRSCSQRQTRLNLAIQGELVKGNETAYAEDALLSSHIIGMALDYVCMLVSNSCESEPENLLGRAPLMH